MIMPISFENPLALLFWLLIPVSWAMMRRSFFNESNRLKKRTIGALRAVLIVLLGLVLSQPKIMSSTDQVNLFFCLDVSESIRNEMKTAATRFMETAAAGMQKEDRAGLILFGKEPYLEIPLAQQLGPIRMQSAVDTNLTNIYGALQFAVGKFSQTGTHRIVLFTDGNENLQHAVEGAHLARSLGIEVYPVPMASGFAGKEVVVKKMETPSAAPLQTPFEIRLIVESAADSNGRLLIFRNDQLFVDQSVSAHPGKNLFVFPDMVSEPGLYRYRAVIHFPEDGFYQNNEGIAFTRGTRKSQLLYLSDGGGPPSPLLQALDRQGLALIQKDVHQLTLNVDALVEYNAVILDNVSGNSLSYETMGALETYVRDFGGGLIVVGGDKSFGAGHYQDTPIEKTLPVSMAPPTRAQFARLCLIFVIDKSSSMSAAYSGKSKLEMAKIAAFSSVEMLNPMDRVGMIAFDSEPKWIVPITAASNRQEIADRLTRVDEGGGTILYPALAEAYRVLQETAAVRKHVIVLSDGETEPADFKGLVESMGESNISVSTVSIGAHSDRVLMKSIADWGEGRNYYTEDPKSIPRIFTGETKIVTRTAIIEKQLQPQQAIVSDMMAGIGDDLPVLYGQVITHPKPGAGTILNTPEGPLLAAWRYGLGRSVAFTSDLSNRWGKAWVKWEHFGRFSAQMIKWAQRPEIEREYTAGIERKGETGTLTVDAVSVRNQFLNHLDLKVNVKPPSGKSRLLPMDQIAPGKYQAMFPAEEIGTYYFSLFEDGDHSANRPRVFGYGIPYTDEFRGMGPDNALLGQIAAISGGQVLELNRPPRDLFTAGKEAKTSGLALWPYLAATFLLFLMIDVATRRLVGV
jgi:Ca-activated chloride channel homolog